jgi:hypothetical protein
MKYYRIDSTGVLVEIDGEIVKDGPKTIKVFYPDKKTYRVYKKSEIFSDFNLAKQAMIDYLRDRVEQRHELIDTLNHVNLNTEIAIRALNELDESNFKDQFNPRNYHSYSSSLLVYENAVDLQYT